MPSQMISYYDKTCKEAISVAAVQNYSRYKTNSLLKPSKFRPDAFLKRDSKTILLVRLAEIAWNVFSRDFNIVGF